MTVQRRRAEKSENRIKFEVFWVVTPRSVAEEY
jgi:hypothetical protein